MKLERALEYLKVNTHKKIYAILYKEGYLIGLRVGLGNLSDNLEISHIESTNIDSKQKFPIISIGCLHESRAYIGKMKYDYMYKEFKSILEFDPTYENLCKELEV